MKPLSLHFQFSKGMYLAVINNTIAFVAKMSDLTQVL